MVNSLQDKTFGQDVAPSEYNALKNGVQDVYPNAEREYIAGNASGSPARFIYETVNVRHLGAAGDGTTSDTVAIAAAFAAAEAENKAVFLPPGTYLTDAINYRGQSIIGTHAEKCILKGKPGQDVLHMDPTFGQFTRARGAWRNFTITVDDSTNAAASFPQRGGVGNAGFAVDFADGAARPYPLMMIGWEYTQVAFNGSGAALAGGRNNVAGIYTQHASILMSEIDNLSFDSLPYGWWDHYPTTNLASAVEARDHCKIGTVYFRQCGRAWRLVNWAYGDVANVIMHATTVLGLEFKAVTAGRIEISHLNFDNVMIEGAADVFAADTNTKVITIRNMVANGAAVTPTWGGMDSKIDHWTYTVTGNPATVLNITGHRNRFSIRPRGDSTATYLNDQVNDTGYGNDVIIDNYTSSNGAFIRQRESASRDGRVSHRRDATSGLLGHVDPMFKGGDDLLINPRVIIPNGSTEGTGHSYITDTTADFGIVLRILGTGASFLFQDNQLGGPKAFRVGRFLPPSKVRIYVKAKVATGGTQIWTFREGTNIKGQTTATLTTSYTVFAFDGDLTGLAVDTTLNLIGASVGGGGAGPLDIAYIMFRPWANDWPVVMQGTSANNGDAAKTLTATVDPEVQRWATALTAARAVTLSTTKAYDGARFRIVREAGATGAFNLNIGTGPLKALTAASTWADVQYDGPAAAWRLVAAGTL